MNENNDKINESNQSPIDENDNIKINADKGEGADAENNKNREEGKQADNEVAFAEEKADEREAGNAAEKEADNSFKAQADSGEGQDGGAQGADRMTDKNTKPRYSASYTPPYYVPSFSATGATGAAAPKTAKKKNNTGVIVALCIVCFLLAASLVVLGAGVITNMIIKNNQGGASNRIDILTGNKVIDIVDTGDRESYSIPEVVDMVASSVVEITTKHVVYNPFYGEYVTGGAGSGVIFDQDGNTGYIVTNYHVIDGAEEITAIIKVDGEQKSYLATYVAGDDAEDIAVLTVTLEEGDELNKASFRNLESSPLRVGEEVVAIGNPLGQLGGTVTNGIISALDREMTVDSNKMHLLQTNAAVNPGNSGGGLFDDSGLLVGIVNAKKSETGIEGLGFAIPADRVLELITNIIEDGYVKGRPTLGIEVKYGTLSTGVTGVIVMEETGGFEEYDCITAINGVAIDSLADYNEALDGLTIGETVEVRVRRGRNYEDIFVKVLEDTSK